MQSFAASIKHPPHNQKKPLRRWIRKLQEAEKQKLHLTIALQVERKRARQMQEQRDNRAKGLSKEEADSIQEEEDFVSDIQDDKLKWMNTQVRASVGFSV